MRKLDAALPAAVLGNGSLLATFSERGRVEHVWCPHPDQEFTPVDLDVQLEGEWSWTQEYVERAQILRTTAQRDGEEVLIEDVVHDTEPVLLRRVSRNANTVVRSFPREVDDPFDQVVERRRELDSARLSAAQPPLQSSVNDLYERSLLVFDALSDRETGAVIAAPECDPHRIYSGGYGFVWARDLAFIVLALLASGRAEPARSALLWFPRAQERSGLWLQRHRTDGSLAPSWCAHQLDETGTVLFAYEAAWRELRDKQLDESLWPSARRAADFLIGTLDDDYLPSATADLWEEREGQHAYTVAAVAAGLRAAACFAERYEPRLREGYAEAAEHAATAVDRCFWSESEGSYLRTLGDTTADASLLGLAWPFGVVDPQSERMRATVAAIERTLGRPGGGLLRYEDDTYAGGNPWVLAALWIGLWQRQTGDLRGHERALEYARRVATPLQLLAEQVSEDGAPVWVMPLAWSHAMLVLAARPELEFVRESTAAAQESPIRVRS